MRLLFSISKPYFFMQAPISTVFPEVHMLPIKTPLSMNMNLAYICLSKLVWQPLLSSRKCACLQPFDELGRM